jgi:hypothetical protein
VFERTANGDDDHHDYEKAVEGFGSDGHARLERVTYTVESNSWGAVVQHNEPNGDTTYEAQSEDGILAVVLSWLVKNRQEADGRVEKRHVAVSKTFTCDTLVEIIVPVKATDEQIKKAALEEASTVDWEKWDPTDSELVHVCDGEHYIY